MITAEEVISLLGLQPHPAEGGFYRETYRSRGSIPEKALPESYDGPRPHATAIYYLVTPESFSAMHRLCTDEIFHFYLGDPVEMLQLLPDGSGQILVLGPDLPRGQSPQVMVRQDVWQGLRLAAGGRFALLGTTVSPGFDFADFEKGSRDTLAAAYPGFGDMITALTR